MKSSFLIATVVAMASATDYYLDPYNELDVSVDGQTQSVYIAQTYWSKIKDYDVPAPSWNDFEFSLSGPCSTLWDGECDGCNATQSCNWSWPLFSEITDPWSNDPAADCRCLPESLIPEDLGSEFTMGFNGRAYLSNTQMFDKEQYYTPNLLGGSLEYDVDLS